MDNFLKTIMWQQFGAAIDMLENAITACPDKIWRNRTRIPEYWYVVFHTLFWLDFYLSEASEGFIPPKPYGLEELDPAGILPDRVYSKEEMLTYLAHCRAKCKRRIEALTDEESHRLWKFGKSEFTITELLLYTLRHVQHHAGQLNLILRQTTDSAPRWVSRAKDKLTAA